MVGCDARIHRPGSSFSRGCKREAVAEEVEPHSVEWGGTKKWWCRQHLPSMKKARREASEKKWQAKWNTDRASWDRVNRRRGQLDEFIALGKKLLYTSDDAVLWEKLRDLIARAEKDKPKEASQ